MARTIDLTPTWGEVGNLIWRFMQSNEQAALEHMRPEFAREMAAAQALMNITKTLSDEQERIVSETLTEELRKQGY